MGIFEKRNVDLRVVMDDDERLVVQDDMVDLEFITMI